MYKVWANTGFGERFSETGQTQYALLSCSGIILVNVSIVSMAISFVGMQLLNEIEPYI